MEIVKITEEEARKIIDKWANNKSSKDIICKYYYLEGKIYIGIDNENGDCWVEEFKTLFSCKKWLG